MSDIDFVKYFLPIEPKNFIGLQDTLNSFSNLVNKFKVGETNLRSVLIIGNNGTGKSSLLLKFRDLITGRRDKTHVFTIETTKDATACFFRNWLKKIDELVPNWSGIFEKMPVLPLLEEETNLDAESTYIENYVNQFFEKLDKVDKKLKMEKVRLYFFVDNISLFRMMRYLIFYKIFANIIEEITKRQYNMFVITTIDETFYADVDYKKKLSSSSEIFKLSPLTESEAQIFIRRTIPKLVNIGGMELIEYSDRTYFDLNLGIAFLKKGLTINDFVEKNLVKLLDLGEEEHKALKELSTYAENLFPKERVLRYVEKETLENLKTKGLL
ncbi:MAG: hypothetical protein ACTSPI_12665, partial [Candidatus Heimdallarchaeaceae archaeon]